MTVRELIALLAKCDPEDTIYVDYDWGKGSLENTFHAEVMQVDIMGNKETWLIITD